MAELGEPLCSKGADIGEPFHEHMGKHGGAKPTVVSSRLMRFQRNHLTLGYLRNQAETGKSCC